MSDMHVMGGGVDGELWDVVMHFPIVSANNSVGVNWRTAVINSGIGGITSLVEGTGDGEITTAEKTQIEAGEIYEHRASLRAESGGTSTANLRATLQEFYAAEKTRVLNALQVQLRYFGHTESET